MKNISSTEIVAAVREASTAVRRRMDMLINDTPLRRMHVAFIVKLYEQGPMTAKELCDALHTDKGHTSRALADMLATDYIDRETGIRPLRVMLTEKGEALAKKYNDGLTESEKLLESMVSLQEINAFITVVHAIREAFDPTAEEGTK